SSLNACMRRSQQAFSAPSKQTQSSNAKDELSSTASINASSTTLIPSPELLASKPRDSTLKREQNSDLKQTQSSNAKDELSSTASINASSTTLIPSPELLASKPRDSTLKREQNSCYEHDNGLMHCSKRCYSITLSARSTRPAGTSCPIVLAVFKFITRSKVVGCSTGISAGFAPLSILATIRARSLKSSTKRGP